MYRELQEAGERNLGFQRAWRTVLRYRFPVILCLAIARGVLDGLGYQHPDDPGIFAEAANRLFSGDWRDTFADQRVQIGPLGVAFHQPITLAADFFGWSQTFSLALIAGVCFTMCVVVVFRQVLTGIGRRSEGLELFVGFAVLAGGPAWAAATSGHPEEGFIALLWVLAGLLARRGRSPLAGLLLGVGIGLKLVGVLGLPILLLDEDVRRAVKGACLAVTTAAILYGPFFLFGRTETFSYVWDVRPHSPLVFLGIRGEPFPWSLRILQTVLILTVGAVLARRRRSLHASVWLLPLGLFALRFLTDPLDYHYYWLPAGTVLLLGSASVLPDGFSWHRLGVGALFYLVILPFFVISTWVLAAYVVVLAAALLVLVERWPEGSPGHFYPVSSSARREIR